MVAYAQAKISIIGVPPGEAPLEIREQWVGLILPLAGGMPWAWEVQTAGVLTGTADEEETIGYAVDTHEAMVVLAERSQEAVDWWRSNTPHLFEEGQALIFDQAVCQLLSP